MRTQVRLQKDWWVSISAKDAALAATRSEWVAEDLDVGGDPENQPQLVNLPGGPQYGKRSESAAAVSGKIRDIQAVTEEFVGPLLVKDARGNRLPNPFLSYAKQVSVPLAWAGQTVFLNLDNARYHVTVSINGRKVTHYVGGLEPHRLDVTRFVTPGQKALILITVGDSGTSGHRPFDVHNYTGTRLPTCKEIQNNLVHPVNYGGSDRAVGIASLEAVPSVRVEYVFADPKVSRGELHYTVVLRNDTAKTARVHVKSEALKGKLLVSEAVTVPARGMKKVRKVVAWADARLWDTDDPFLYKLRTTLTEEVSGVRGQGAGRSRKGRSARRHSTLDTHFDTFGFREFTINGHSMLLNGKKIHLFNQSGHTSPDQDWMTLKQKIEYLRTFKDKVNVNHMRLHAKPQHKEWVIAADRVGMLVTTETALWTTGFHSFDWAGSERACTENVRNHFLEALVRRDRNNPSVILWSLSNEMSPITPFDLENPKMAAITRAFRKIIAETRAEDSSRVIQMSSAMDFIGNLDLYNLHYPKSWSAFPDYPHTAYWLDRGFLFPWYGPRRNELPSWSWRQDKPLLFGEFSCVFGPTPDKQASIIGDVAFEREDYGTLQVQEKLWPLEIASYRRLDVTGFCAWACLFHETKEVKQRLARADVKALAHSQRPLAVLCHTYRTDYLAADEIAIELSMHNDTRRDQALELVCEYARGKQVIWRETWPKAVFAPAESKAFTSRCRAPQVEKEAAMVLRVTLRADGKVADRWEKPLHVFPRASGVVLPAGLVVYDPDGVLAARFQARGISGAAFVETLAELRAKAGAACVWLNFDLAKIHYSEWIGLKAWLSDFVGKGGVAVIDNAPANVLAEMPVEIQVGKGFAKGAENTLEITYAYNAAPHHPVTAGLNDKDLGLWGADYYVAHRTYDIPQEGNAVPLLVAGSAESGLTMSPLMEVRQGQGSYLLSSLEIITKLDEAPVTLRVLAGMAGYRPSHRFGTAGFALGSDTLRMCREVGLMGNNAGAAAALAAEVSLVDGEKLADGDLPAVRAALDAGRTVCLHALSPEQTAAVLKACNLPGTVLSGKTDAREYDVFRHTSPLADGMTNNYLYWIVDKAKLPPWSAAPLHPEPATALVKLEAKDVGERAWSITRRGAVVVYRAGAGTLVIDNLRWHLSNFDEPERPRRYVGRMMTNLGMALQRGAAKRYSQDFETEAERRERGHF